MKKLTKILLAATLVMISCKSEYRQLEQVDGKRIAVDNSVQEDPEIAEFIAPYKQHLNETLTILPPPDSLLRAHHLNLSAFPGWEGS